MRRAVSLFHPTGVLRGRHALALRPTRALYIPPQLARLLVAGGLLLFQAFITAHEREAQKLREETQGTGTTTGGGSATLMSSSEALQILGLDRRLSLPLGDEADRQEATRRFRRLFAIAKETNNVYLEGKFSAAYRLCVDPEWDAADASSDGGSNNAASNNGVKG
ncbi:hypothetical protein DQ04_01291040 [Trypanosoma grayi]|uniref:hypothetical protein n=1 Tax=Trypanosoma grayi TaxID=71804 RepID=UPI0004F45C11|nr:hypothetical protein DQ04_01291040 [Trypanosoma grayi]KEG12974.1 hypothetical protein DQ04_01291040 [Trypanosoma grayi]